MIYPYILVSIDHLIPLCSHFQMLMHQKFLPSSRNILVLPISKWCPSANPVGSSEFSPESLSAPSAIRSGEFRETKLTKTLNDIRNNVFFNNVLQKWSRFSFWTRVVLCMPILPVIRTLQILLRCVAISYWWSWVHLAAGQISHWLKSTISGLAVSCDDHIFLPGTQMTLFSIGICFVLQGWSLKMED